MKTLIKTFLGLFLLAGISSVQAQTVYNFNDGLSAAKSQSKKIIINIYSDSDKWSKKMETEVYSNGDVQSLMGSFIYIKLNPAGSESYDYKGKKYSAAELAKVLGLTSYPTHSFMTSGGEVIKFKYNGVESSSFPGYVDAGDFKNILIYFRDGKYSDTDLTTVL
jgi:thioredoxin-related protein